MADNYIPYQNPTSTDLKLDSESLTVGANTVERERIQVTGSTATAIATVIQGTPGSLDWGLVTRNIPSGTQTIAGTVTATATDLDIRDLTSTADSFLAYQGGTWNIGTLSTISNPVTVSATNLDIRDLTSTADQVLAFQGGAPWSVSQSGNWNVSTVQTVTAVSTITAVVQVADNQSSLTVDQGGTWTVQPGNTANTTAWLVKETRSTTPTLSQIDATTSSRSFFAANTSRLGAIIYNDSPNSVWISFGGSTVSASSFSYTIMSNGTWELPFQYTGLISGRWVAGAGTGQAKLTEIT